VSEGVRRPRLLLTLRLLAAIPGGYAFSAVWVAALGGLLVYAGLQRSDAVVLAAMLGYLFFLVFLVWCFAQRSVARIWTVTLAGSALCAGVLVLLNLGR
jgi:hypothetical protein